MAQITSDGEPISHGPSDKEKKYDRQLRLWAASGQEALESSHLLLVNSGGGTVGVETLKNLILPGIGKFTIADDAVVDDADLGVNFFLDESTRGKSRAEFCTNFLLELNPEVSGDWYPKGETPLDLQQVLAESTGFTVIIYTLPLEASKIELLEEYGRQHAIPVVSVHSVGYYAYFKVTLPNVFPVVDTHPEPTSTEDLRLLTPWPQLAEFAASMTQNIDNLDGHEHGHLPMVVILLHYIELWKQEHNGNLPINYSDKTAFRKIILGAMRTNNPEGGEENFEEAASAVMKHVVMPTLPSSLKAVFEYASNKTPTTSSFWIIASALKEFYELNQRLPVSGGLPDMKAQSSVYIQLQNIYKSKARQDSSDILARARQIPGGESIGAAEVDMFCANARFIELINSKDDKPILSQVVDAELERDQIAAIAGPEMPLSLIPIYLALTAISHQNTASAEDIQASVLQRVPALNSNERAMKIAEEVARSKGGELHNISAAVGGMVAQEIIKIVTQQYIPIDNACIYDGIESKCQVIRL